MLKRQADAKFGINVEQTPKLLGAFSILPSQQRVHCRV
jgi:hypothetical protein